MLNVYQVPLEEIHKIEWQGDSALFDHSLSKLGKGHTKFLIVNPQWLNLKLHTLINSIPAIVGNKCIVWKFQGKWIAKYFNTKYWKPSYGYVEVKMDSLLVWEQNPIFKNIVFENNPSDLPLDDMYDLPYELVWYLDSMFNPTADKIWVMKCKLFNNGTKDMGFVSPLVNKITNPDIPQLEYIADYTIPWYDLQYEHVWMLNNSLHDNPEPIWAVKIIPDGKLIGTKFRGDVEVILPNTTKIINPDIPQLEYIADYTIPLYDLQYEHVWMLNNSLHDNSEPIWAVKIIPDGKLIGTKFRGDVEIPFSNYLDVIFISYNEPNAEENWKRTLQYAPNALRVNGVSGIFEAHKAAAELATTDMFYVVDGDAYLVDNWTFNYQPTIFDRDCVHVWHSRNPVNDLEYGYGGVKLFPRELLLNATEWKIDMSTSLGNKLKVMPQVSNVTVFNTDPFSTWRSAFRECAKLAAGSIINANDNETQVRLNVWMDKSRDRYAYAGARAGYEYGISNKDNLDAMKLINNRDWLKQQFDTSTKINKIIPIAKEVKTNSLCAVPWMHLAFEPSGQVVPCCLTSTHNYFAGDLNTESIDEIWNSDNMKSLRKEMISGNEPKICSKCFDREKVTGESSRTYHARDFPDVLTKIPKITLEDGTCTEMKLKYWDFRFSNLCNFKCRSCGPRYSSAWVPDSKKLGHAIQEKVWSIEAVDDKTNFDFLKDQIQHVERIYFAGGEPLMMPEHWQILDMLVENKRFDVKLSYNTNASLLTYQKKNIIDYWKQWEFGKLEVWPSIDEIGSRAELIRSGTVWSKVEGNLKELAKLDNAIIRPGLTIGAMNVFRLPEIVTHLVDIGVVNEKLKYKNFFINLLEFPLHYHVSILPDDFRKEIITKLTEFVIFHNQKYDTDITALFSHIIHELNKPHDRKSAEHFIKISSQLDEIRNEDIFEVIPELNKIKEILK